MGRQLNFYSVLIVYLCCCGIILFKALIPSSFSSSIIDERLKTGMMVGGRRTENGVKTLLVIPIICWSLMLLYSSLRIIRLLNFFVPLGSAFVFYFVAGDRWVLGALAVQAIMALFLPQLHSHQKHPRKERGLESRVNKKHEDGTG